MIFDSLKIKTLFNNVVYLIKSKLSDSEFKLFIDDERFCVNTGEFYIVRTYEEAISAFDRFKFPTYIMFDHDLGIDGNGNIRRDGMDIAKYIVDFDMDNDVISDDFMYCIHSRNVNGAKNIDGLLSGYLKFKRG